MKRYLLFIFTLCLFTTFLTAQSFSDDFESYNVGDYVGQASSTWTTWSGTTGGAEDARVTDAEAASGSNSIYFVSGGGGGPQDVILPFGRKYTSGSFTFSMDMYIPRGRAGYFNFQGEVAVGTTWTMNTYLNADGTFRIDDSSIIWFNDIYPQGEWFTILFEINLTANIWKVTVGDKCLGSYAAGNNSVASLDLFPATGSDEFYVDNVAFEYDPNAEIPKLEAGLLNGTADVSGISGTEKTIQGAIVNNGTEAITSFTVEYESSSFSGSQSFTNILINRGEFYNFTLDDQLSLEDGNTNVNIRLTEINGASSDEDECNNTLDIVFTGFTPAAGRAVYVEEGTGTWCQWCPRGDVFMNRMQEKYQDNFVGVAVHNGDPMVEPEWDNGVGGFPGFDGYPGVIVGRTTVTDPSQMETDLISRVQVEPTVVFEHGASYDASTRELQISVTSTAMKDFSGNYTLIVGLTEDDVRGTNSGYNQSNAYAGGGAGIMGGYELLPNPVPANLMVYNHVGRALLTPFTGMAGAYGTETVTTGEERTHGFSITIPQEWNIENMNIVTALRNFFGQIDNAKKTSVNDAENNGLSTNTYDVELETSSYVYPNPFSDFTNIELNLETPAEVKIEVMDAIGKVVASKYYGLVSGNNIFEFNGSNLVSGVYYLKLYTGEKFATKRVIISR